MSSGSTEKNSLVNGFILRVFKTENTFNLACGCGGRQLSRVVHQIVVYLRVDDLQIFLSVTDASKNRKQKNKLPILLAGTWSEVGSIKSGSTIICICEFEHENKNVKNWIRMIFILFTWTVRCRLLFFWPECASLIKSEHG